MSLCETCTKKNTTCPIEPVAEVTGCIMYNATEKQQVQLLGLYADQSGSGKDTLFDQLKEKDDRLVNIKFAEALAETLYGAFQKNAFSRSDLEYIRNDPVVKDKKFMSFSPKNLDPDFDKYCAFLVDKKGIALDQPMSFREHMVLYGTDYVREYLGDQDRWLRHGLQSAKDAYTAGLIPVITDVRMPNEIEAVQKIGGKVINIVADWALQKAADAITQKAEGHLKGWKFDLEINNVFNDPSMMSLQFFANYKF